jgi:AcrR family transcriptional regulator
MPPKIRFSRADLLHAAFKLTREKGIDAVSARAVANELGCSTQPIFRAFRSMQDIRGEMCRMAMDRYDMYLLRGGAMEEKPYLRSGMASIAFAREEPELFKLLFMGDYASGGAANERMDREAGLVADLVMSATGFNREAALRFLEHIWIYTHGLALMIATRCVALPDDRAEQLLMEEYRAVRGLFGPEEPNDWWE